MFSRARWLATGVALGAGTTIWARKRMGEIQERFEAGKIAGDLAGATKNRVRAALDAGREQAQRRETEIRTSLEGRQRADR